MDFYLTLSMKRRIHKGSHHSIGTLRNRRKWITYVQKSIEDFYKKMLQKRGNTLGE